MHAESLLELNAPVADLEPGPGNILQIPLSATIEVDLSAPQPLVDGEVRAAGKVPCEFPACQAGGKICTAVC
jgi:hypothetical protein